MSLDDEEHLIQVFNMVNKNKKSGIIRRKSGLSIIRLDLEKKVPFGMTENPAWQYVKISTQ